MNYLDPSSKNKTGKQFLEVTTIANQKYPSGVNCKNVEKYKNSLQNLANY